MDKQDILRMAREAGFLEANGKSLIQCLEAFAALVAAAAKAEEREACAKVCENIADQFHAHAMDCAAAIRARQSL